MVDKFLKIIREIKDVKGDVELFAILKMDNITDKWSVICAANWINETNRREQFSFILNIMDKFLSIEEKTSIARVGLMPMDNYFTESFMSAFNITEAVRPVYVKSTQVNGSYIEEGYIFECHRYNPNQISFTINRS